MTSCANLLSGSLSNNLTQLLCLENGTAAAPTTRAKHRLTGISSWDDATWVMSSAFIIFTMQSGFGLLESGMVSRKNEVNIMVKNIVDVIFGGLAFWAFGYAFAFGDGSGSNPFCGVGRFFTDATNPEMGNIFSKFFFQLSFATTAITIVSGAMAERTKLESYCMFSAIGILIYCFPAHWVWADNGWLATLGVVDIAGCGVVHVVGGVTGLVATIMLKPRIGRFTSNKPVAMGSPVTAILGLFVLWWGWLGFNCGSTFGITGEKWQLAARAAVNTLNASIGGGIFSFVYSYVYFTRKVDVSYVIVGILGGLVSVSGICPLARPWESLVIGTVGGCLGCVGRKLIEKLKIDDPTGCLAAHTMAGVWGLISVGFFTEIDTLENFATLNGVFKGGSGWLLGVQLLAIVSLIAWSAVMSILVLLLLDKTVGLRVSVEEENLGADIVEHEMDYNKTENTRQMKAIIGLNMFISRKIEPQKRGREIRRESSRMRATAFTVKIEEVDKEESSPKPYMGRRRAGAAVLDIFDSSDRESTGQNSRSVSPKLALVGRRSAILDLENQPPGAVN